MTKGKWIWVIWPMVERVKRKGDSPKHKKREPRWLTYRLHRTSNQIESTPILPESGYAKLMESYRGNGMMPEYLKRIYGLALSYIRLLPGPSDETKDLIKEEFIGGKKNVVEKVGLEMAMRLRRESSRSNLEFRSYCMVVALNIDVDMVSKSARSASALNQRNSEVRNEPWEVFLAKHRSRKI